MDDASPLPPDSPGPGIETHRQRQAIAERLFGVCADPVRVGRFEVSERIGEGAMGIVYRAFDPKLRRDVALKVLHAGIGSGASERGPNLLTEARTLAGLSHPNLVEILDVGMHDERAYVAMELVAGGTLAGWAAGQPAAATGRTAEALALFEQAAAGLAAAHARGVIHRDIKPANMLLGDDGRVRLADFGLARQEGLASTEEPSRADSGEGSRSHHALAGTLVYMAPERFSGAPASVQSDIFALSVSLWEVLFGRRPFAGATASELKAAVGLGAPPPPRRPATSRRLQRLLAKGLAPDPSDRFASAEALREALVACRTGARAGRARRLGAAIAGLAVVGLWAIASRPDPRQPCAEAPDDVAAAWPQQTRARVREAFVAAIADHGAALFDTVGPRVDALTEEWVTSWRDNCEATWVDHTQTEANFDRRSLCLDRARAALVAYTGDLHGLTSATAPDATAVRDVAERVGDLPDVGKCDDIDALRAQVPLPRDPQLRAEIVAIEHALYRWRHTAYGGPPQEARSSIDALVARAEATGHVPIVVEALGRRAGLLADDRSDEAIAQRERALALAEQAGLDAHAAKVAIDLFSDMRLLGKDEDAARQYLRRAEAHLRRVGDTPQGEVARAHLLHFEAVALEDDGNREAALDKRRERLAHFEQTLGPAHTVTALARKDLGVALTRLGRFNDAEPELRRALEDIDAKQPADLDAQSQAVSALAIWAVATRHADEAVRLAERQVELTAVSLGPDHPRRVTVLNHLGAALATAGDTEAGVEVFEASLALADRVLPEADRQRIVTRLHLTKVVEARPRRLKLLAEARDLALEHLGADSYLYAESLAALAAQAWIMDDNDLIVASLQESLPSLEKHGRPVQLVSARAYLSMALTAKGELQPALDQAEASVSLARSIDGFAPAAMSLPYLARARVHHAAGRHDLALADIEEAEKAAALYASSNAAVTRIAKLAAELRGG